MFCFGTVVFAVMPANAGIQLSLFFELLAKGRIAVRWSNNWIPAFAGMTTSSSRFE
jgi:hypothetical protein